MKRAVGIPEVRWAWGNVSIDVRRIEVLHFSYEPKSVMWIWHSIK